MDSASSKSRAWISACRRLKDGGETFRVVEEQSSLRLQELAFWEYPFKLSEPLMYRLCKLIQLLASIKVEDIGHDVLWKLR